MTDDTARALLRHMVATLAYRAAKALRHAPPSFAEFRVSATTRMPLQIVTHMGDLFDWALSIAQDRTEWHDSPPMPWDLEVSRFFSALTAFDAHLASDAPLSVETIAKLVQGPVADALTHTGQLTMLRRAAGSPVKGESYARAEIVAGRTGAEQAPARWEFD